MVEKVGGEGASERANRVMLLQRQDDDTQELAGALELWMFLEYGKSAGLMELSGTGFEIKAAGRRQPRRATRDQLRRIDNEKEL